MASLTPKSGRCTQALALIFGANDVLSGWKGEKKQTLTFWVLNSDPRRNIFSFSGFKRPYFCGRDGGGEAGGGGNLAK